ncbi:MAG: hypothetical protein U9Q18_06985 [Caldisericota bacterium]|nr:hypothetical protein [Caldisericota bacterium]
MKEKISKYINGEGNKEEIKKLLGKDKEAREYYEQLSEMKAMLSDMKVNALPGIEENVLKKVHRKRFRVPYRAISFAAILLVLFLFLKVPGLKYDYQLGSPEIDNNIRTTAPAEDELPYESGPGKGFQGEFILSHAGFEIMVEESEKTDVIALLAQYGKLKSGEENLFVYTIDSETLPVVLEKLEKSYKISNINIPEKEGTITLTVKINSP